MDRLLILARLLFEKPWAAMAVSLLIATLALNIGISMSWKPPLLARCVSLLAEHISMLSYPVDSYKEVDKYDGGIRGSK